MFINRAKKKEDKNSAEDIMAINSNYLKNNPEAVEALTLIAEREINAYESKSTLEKVASSGWQIAKDICTPATIGAVVGYLTTRTQEGALQGAVVGAAACAPLVGYGMFKKSLSDHEEKIGKKVKNYDTVIYCKEKPILVGGFGSILIGCLYTASVGAVDLFFGTNLSGLTAFKIGGIYSVYAIIRSAGKSKKIKEKIKEEIALGQTRKELGLEEVTEILDKELQEKKLENVKLRKSELKKVKQGKEI